MSMNKVKSCMVGECVFKVGDRVSIAQGISKYTGKLSIYDMLNLKLVDIYCEDNNNKSLPYFKGIVETFTGKQIEIGILDLVSYRDTMASNIELIKAGYNFNDGRIYSNGYETFDGDWLFYNVGMVEKKNSLQYA